MGKIDVSEWREFKAEDLFGKSERGTRITQTDRIDGEIPLVTAGFINEGIAGYINNPNMRLFSNCLTIDMFGNCFYRDYSFNADDNILCFGTSVSKASGLFIASIFNRNRHLFDYKNQYRQNNYVNEVLLLPATPSGDPDWEYMENYIKNIEDKVNDVLSKMQVAKEIPKKSVDVSGWKKFRVGDYFDVTYGKFIPKNKLDNGSFHYITTSGLNNGITNKIDKATHNGNCITVASDGAMGASFYQSEPFSTSNIVSTLTPLKDTPLNQYNAQFICSLIFAKRHNFGWSTYKLSVDRLRNLIISLPATPSGDPDWAYMESYMRGIEEKVINNLEKCEVIKN